MGSSGHFSVLESRNFFFNLIFIVARTREKPADGKYQLSACTWAEFKVYRAVARWGVLYLAVAARRDQRMTMAVGWLRGLPVLGIFRGCRDLWDLSQEVCWFHLARHMNCE